MSTGDTSGFSLKYYKWKTTNSDAEAVHPSGTTGWAIADAARYKSGSSAWTSLASGRTGMVHIAVDD